jgi:hypothetical protein
VSADALYEVLPALGEPLSTVEGGFGEVGRRKVQQERAFECRRELHGQDVAVGRRRGVPARAACGCGPGRWSLLRPGSAGRRPGRRGQSRAPDRSSSSRLSPSSHTARPMARLLAVMVASLPPVRTPVPAGALTELSTTRAGNGCCSAVWARRVRHGVGGDGRTTRARGLRSRRVRKMPS